MNIRRFYPNRLNAATVTLLYALFASLWIVSSGLLLTYATSDSALQDRIELIKGLVFVAISSGLLFLLLKVWREPKSATGEKDISSTDSGMARLILLFVVLSMLIPLAGLVIFKIYAAQIEQYEYLLATSNILFWFSLAAVCVFTAACAAGLLLWRQQRHIQQLEYIAHQARTDQILRHFYEMPFIGMAMLSAEKRDWVRVNDRLCEIVGYTEEELQHKSLQAMVHPDDSVVFTDNFNRLLQGHANEFTIGVRLLRKDGTVAFTNIDVDCIRKQDNGVDYLFVLIQDISIRKRAQNELHALNRELEQRVADRTETLERTNAQLQFANKELESYSYSVSHDLRAPLRAISGFSEILKRRYNDQLPAEAQHYLDNIIEAGSRMDRLIDDLLNYSRIGHRSVTLQKTSLFKILEEACDDLADRIKQAGIHLVVPAPGQLPEIYCNQTLLHQIFINLLANAVTYHRPDTVDGPRVRIYCDDTPDNIIIHFEDNGIGIEPTYHEKIFEMFQRLHSDEMYTGTGIGLAIVKKAVTLLDGKVWLASTPGEGTTFSLQLPKRRP